MLLLKYCFPSLSSFRLESPFTALTRAFRSFFVNSLFCRQNSCCCKMCKGWHNHSKIFVLCSLLGIYSNSISLSNAFILDGSDSRIQIKLPKSQTLQTQKNENTFYFLLNKMVLPLFIQFQRTTIACQLWCDSCKYLIMLFQIFHQSFAQKLIWDDANISLQKVKYGPWRTTISCANSTFEVGFSLCKTMQWS